MNEELQDNVALLKAEISRQVPPTPSTMPRANDERLYAQWEAIRLKLVKHRIRSDTPLPERKHLLEIQGISSFPRGDLVAISGREKCGKTTDCRILVSALLRGEYMGVKALEQDVRVLWIDTEQAVQTTRSVTRGIELMCGFRVGDEQFAHYSLRDYPDRQEMQQTLDVQFDDFRPDMVIVDGIRDYIDDFNDVVSSSQIVQKCMALSSGVSAEQSALSGLAERPPCCVVAILHQNKTRDDNSMRGHLGTELANKAGEVWEASRDDDRVFAFTQRCSRTRPVEEPLRYTVHSQLFRDDQGQTEEIGVPEVWTTEIEGEGQAEDKTNAKTKRHNFVQKMSKPDALAFFAQLMQNHGFGYEELKNLCWEKYNISYAEFSAYRDLLGGKIYKASDGLWYFDHTRDLELPDQ